MNLFRRHSHILPAPSVLACLFLLVLSVSAGQQSSPGIEPMTKNPTTTTDKDVVKKLASHNWKKATWAVQEVMRRGPSMIPLLLKNKGNRQPFRGWGLGNPQAAQSMFWPTGNAKLDEGRVITLEVASLYLISALYYETLEFAQSPNLTDLSLPLAEQRTLNTRELIEKAWTATEAWAITLAAGDIESLRSKQQDPLKDSQVGFW